MNATSPATAPAPAMQPDFWLETTQELHPVPNRPGDYYLKVRTVPRTGDRRNRDLLLTAVADELGLSLRRVQELCEEGRIRSYIPGVRHRRVKPEWLEEYKRSRGML